MRILAGLELSGASLTAFNDLEGCGCLGAWVCGPNQLLDDLELRLGRARATEPEPVRVACWQARVARCASAERFYSRSFALDPLATARTLLTWRDGLVEAGWTGAPIAGDGPRLEALAELEALDGSPVPIGAADRLRDVAQALLLGQRRIYAQLLLAEPAGEWGTLWQRIFDALAARGTEVSSYAPELPGAAPTSDLGRIQAALAGVTSDEPAFFEGDGSFVVLTAETSWEAARATAALCSLWAPEQTVIIRQDDASALDHALDAQCLPTQGWAPRSPWRAALQVLPLALELAFEPKDPARILELVTLPGGPFAGRTGRHLAQALSRSPGVGGPSWEQAKSKLTAHASETGERDEARETLREHIARWLEQPGADPIAGAPVSSLLAVIERVHEWLLSRIARSPQDPTLLAAAHQAASLRTALTHESRATLDLLSMRRKVENLLGPGVAARILPEQCGRMEHVDHAERLSAASKNVIWWGFANGGTGLARLPWNRRERLALAARGVRFPDPAARAATRALQRRRALLAATERLLLVVPRTVRGQSVAVDPLWDEVVARVAPSNPEALGVLHLNARDLLSPRYDSKLLAAPRRAPVSVVSLPGGHVEWTLGAGLPRPAHHSASSLAALLACPLKWALGYSAGLRTRGHGLPQLHRLSGDLGHRLVELLHAEQAFDLPHQQLTERAESVLDALIAREGALLLRPGMSFELAQLREQLVRAVGELARLLRARGATIDSVEQDFSVPWRGGALTGRLDLLLCARDGSRAILDLKWGTARYRDALSKGQALQLAVYTAAHASAGTSVPEAAYFSLKGAKLLGLAGSRWVGADCVRGPTLTETWSRIERSMERAEKTIAERRFPVSGLQRSLPLLESFGVPHDAQQGYYAAKPEDACEYCDFDAVCGRRWEASRDGH